MKRTVLLRNLVAGALWLHPSLRRMLLNRMGYRLGTGTFISPPVTFKGDRVVTGEGCYLNSGVFVGRGPLTLGSRVFVGPGVTFVTNSHELGTPDKRAGHNIVQPIVVGSGVWIGARAVVLGGVRIGAGCVIGAGAIVTSDTEPDGLYVGAPARRIRDLGH